jgi:uncharacterized paraquat-inducible protein A
MALLGDWIHSGIVRCPDCGRDFEATAFNPPVRRLRVAQVATAGPAEANACANHERNAAVTSCQRCGLFICSLCDMNVGSGSYCPACFDRLRTEGTDPAMATKTRDYRAMALVATIAGFFMIFIFIGFVFGALALVYLSRGATQRAARGQSRWTVGMVVMGLFALLEILGSIGYDTMLILILSGALK